MADPDDTYRALVADVVRERGDRTSLYVPEMKRVLQIASVHRPASVEALCADELMHLRAIFGGRLEAHLRDREKRTECASVRDEATGEIVHRLYAWNYGVLYLFDALRVRLVAHATQHTVEVWSTSQRALFFEMDAALRRPDHGLDQPLAFEWWNDFEWDEVIGAEPGTVASQPWLAKLLGP